MQNILTVSQLNYAVRHLIEAEFEHIWLIGEISNLSKPVSGHWYFTLKDDQAQVRCAMFRQKNRAVNFSVQNGMQVLVRASVSLYEPRGDYQAIVETMQPAGDGLLQQQFEALKRKLAAAGLFAQADKKPLPNFVKKVGIITSSSGAALHDMLNVLHRRDPSLAVIIYPTLVQGKDAATDIATTIALANLRQECDVLIVGRGGGSLEDLWCFNEECVAYAIYQSQIPIISAVGHETDVTIADFVADLRAPTPSAAAELVSRDQSDLQRRLQHQFEKASFAFDRIWADKTAYFTQLQLRLNHQHPYRQWHHLQQMFEALTQRSQRAIKRHLSHPMNQLHQLEQRLKNQHPQRQLQRQQSHLEQLNQRLHQQCLGLVARKQQQWQAVVQRLKQNPLPYHVADYQHQMTQLAQRVDFAAHKLLTLPQQQFHALCTQLEGLSPLKILARGYSVTTNAEGKALTCPQTVKMGDKITSRLAQGEIVSEVIFVKQNAENTV